jgi:hypothetical protein
VITFGEANHKRLREAGKSPEVKEVKRFTFGEARFASPKVITLGQEKPGRRE